MLLKKLINYKNVCKAHINSVTPLVQINCTRSENYKLRNIINYSDEEHVAVDTTHASHMTVLGPFVIQSPEMDVKTKCELTKAAKGYSVK